MMTYIQQSKKPGWKHDAYVGSIPNFRENSATLVKTKEINSEFPTFNN